MKAPTASRLAWLLWTLGVALAASTLLLGYLAQSGPGAMVPTEDVGFGVAVVVLLVTLSTVGRLLASRRPDNPLGWLIFGVALSVGLGIAGEQYATLASAESPLPAASWVAWLSALAFGHPATFGWFLFLLLLFPDGHLPSPRWRWFARAAAATALAVVAIFILQPGSLPNLEIQNPAGIQAFGKIKGIQAPLVLAFFGLLLVSAASLFIRFKRAQDLQRRQIKWIAFSGVFLAVAFATGPIWWSLSPGPGDVIWPLLVVLGTASVPVAIGIAILRHRLYDIDVIIKKTLIYGVLTTALGAVYFSMVVLLQGVLTFTDGSDLTIAGSTLGVAALFGPMRRRVQSFVDRRFYRRRYDAARTLEAFSARLRQEIDLDALGSELRAVASETMQPAHVSIWVRTAGRPS